MGMNIAALTCGGRDNSGHEREVVAISGEGHTLGEEAVLHSEAVKVLSSSSNKRNHVQPELARSGQKSAPRWDPVRRGIPTGSSLRGTIRLGSPGQVQGVRFR